MFDRAAKIQSGLGIHNQLIESDVCHTKTKTHVHLKNLRNKCHNAVAAVDPEISFL